MTASVTTEARGVTRSDVAGEHDGSGNRRPSVRCGRCAKADARRLAAEVVAEQAALLARWPVARGEVACGA